MYKMIPPRTKDSSSWCSKNTFASNSRYILCNAPFKIDKELLADKSAKIASLLKINPFQDLSTIFQEIPSDPGALELVARFCHGFEVNITSENIIPLICLSNHLQMTETHCPNNLLEKAISFLKQNILTSWDHIIRSLRASRGPTVQQAVEIGLLSAFIEALADFALSDPTLLAQPIMVEFANNNNNNNRLMKRNSSANNATRRKLFADHSSSSTSSDCSSSNEDLTSLPLKLYEPIIEEMTQRRVPQENIAGSLYKYFKQHGNDDKEAIEAVERLLPSTTSTVDSKYPLYPYTLLFEMHGLGVHQGVSSECIASLEDRIGKELYRATTDNLLALDLEIEGLRRILKGFYGNFNDVNPKRLMVVAELTEEYLVEVAKKKEIDAKMFTEVAEMVSSTLSVGSYRRLDGVYRAVDAYLDKHKELVESEREEVCKVLDFQKMSPEAVEHAALSTRLPLRVVMQALFVSQLQLKDNISKAVGGYFGKSNSSVDDSQRSGKEDIRVLDGEDDTLNDVDEMEEISNRVFCHEKNCGGKKKKVSLWKGMKRKFGCMGSSSTDYETLNKCNCQVTNMNKKNKKK